MGSIKKGCPVCNGETRAEGNEHTYTVKCEKHCYTEQYNRDRFFVRIFNKSFTFSGNDHHFWDKVEETIESWKENKKYVSEWLEGNKYFDPIIVTESVEITSYANKNSIAKLKL